MHIRVPLLGPAGQPGSPTTTSTATPTSCRTTPPASPASGGRTWSATTRSRPRAPCADASFAEMGAYILRRLLLIVPTLFGILLVNFVLVQFMPGGPVEQVLAELQQEGGRARPHRGGGGGRRQPAAGRRLPRRPGPAARVHRRARAPVRLRQAARQRFLLMLRNYLTFDFGESYFRSISVVDLVLEKMPVSISLGLWSTLLAYLDLDPARHPQGDPRRQPLRHRDQRRHHRRLRHPELPLRGHAARALRRRLLLAALPAARPHLRQLGGALRSSARCSTTSGTSRCR